MARLKVKQWPVDLECGKGSILDAALREGLPYPHNCRSGECGECKSNLISGEVEHGLYFDEVLSEAERQKGIILACRARALSDIEVAWIKETDSGISIPVKNFKAKVTSIDAAAHNVVRLRMRIKGAGMTFAAGQYMRIKVGNLPARSFSMANLPSEFELEFHVRRVAGGLVSGYISSDLKIGDSVQLEGPFGTSHFRENHQGDIVLLAGGTGLAPMLSIARQALKQSDDRRIRLYFGVQDEPDVYCEQKITDLTAAHPNLSCQIVLSAAQRESARCTGFLHEALAKDISDFTGTKVYAAGPPIMVDAVSRLVQQRGLTLEDIHSDPFVESADSTALDSPTRGGLFGGLARIIGRG